MIIYAYRPSAVDIRFSARHVHARNCLDDDGVDQNIVSVTTVSLG